MVSDRTNHRRIAWLALFALWLQFALSFGHFHPEDFLLPAAASVSGEGAVAQVSLDRRAIPGSPVGEGLAHEACAICATMHLAGALVLPEPVTLSAPALLGEAPAPIDHSHVPAHPSHLLFSPRAPPVI